MKRKIKHVRAGANEWVRVHRNPLPPSGGDWGDPWLKIGLWAGGILLGLWLLSKLLPFLILGAVGWFVFQFLARR